MRSSYQRGIHAIIRTKMKYRKTKHLPEGEEMCTNHIYTTTQKIKRIPVQNTQMAAQIKAIHHDIATNHL